MRIRVTLLFLATALLGGCYAPYPGYYGYGYGPRYAYYHPYPHYYWWR